MIELFWLLAEKAFSSAFGLTEKSLTRTESQAVLERTVAALRVRFSPGPEGRPLLEAIETLISAPLQDWVQDKVMRSESMKDVFTEVLAPLLTLRVQRGPFQGETGRELLARHNLDLARLADLVNQAAEQAVFQVAAERGGLLEKLRQAEARSADATLERLETRLDDLHRESGSPPALDTLVAPPQIMVGREEEAQQVMSAVEAADAARRPVVLSALHGMAGVGKTALARTVAAQLTDHYPDARFEVDLYGFTPGETPRQASDVLSELLAMAGFRLGQVPPDTAGKSEVWRSWLTSRKVLLLLDNARDAGQVHPLRPGGAHHCLVIVTSRNRLDDLEGAIRVSLDTLPELDAIALLTEISGQPRYPGDQRAELARLCGYLPLALRPVGALLADIDDAALVEAMRTASSPFKFVPDAERAARAAFQVSYDVLTQELQRSLRACAWHPGPDLDAFSLAALTGLPRSAAALHLIELFKSSMITRLLNGRYAFHDVFRGYAHQQADADDRPAVVEEGRRRLFARLLAGVDAATDEWSDDHGQNGGNGGPMFGAAQRAQAWLTGATAELNSASVAAIASQWEQAYRLAHATAWWLIIDGRPDQAQALYNAVREAADADRDRLSQAHAVQGLGDVARMCDKYGQAAQAYSEARTLYGETGDQLGQVNAMMGLGHVARLLGEYHQAAEDYRQARALYEELGDRLGLANATMGLAEVARLRGEYAQAAEAYAQAHSLYQEGRDRLGLANATLGLGRLARLRGEFEQAAEAYAQTRTLSEAIGYRLGQADGTRESGETARLRGDYTQAAEAYAQSSPWYEEIGDRLGQNHALRGLGDAALSRGDYQQATELYAQARALGEEIGDRLGQANAAIGLGHVARLRGEYGEAADTYAQAQALYAQIGDALGQANVQLSLARTAEHQGNQSAAIAAYVDAESQYRTLGLASWADYCAAVRVRVDEGQSSAAGETVHDYTSPPRVYHLNRLKIH